MSSLQLLNAKIDLLIEQSARLREEVRALRFRENQLLAERDELILKNEAARERVEAIIGRLKQAGAGHE